MNFSSLEIKVISEAQERLRHAIYCLKLYERHTHTHAHQVSISDPPKNLCKRRNQCNHFTLICHTATVFFLYKQDLLIFASGLIRTSNFPGIIVSCDPSLWINLLPVNLLLKLAGGALRHGLATDCGDLSVHIPPQKKRRKRDEGKIKSSERRSNLASLKGLTRSPGGLQRARCQQVTYFT